MPLRDDTSRARRRVTRIVLLCLCAAAVAAAVAGATHAAGMWGSPSHAVQEQLRRAIVGYELAKAPERPPAMVGKKLTKVDRAALQARFLRRLARHATGPALAWGRTWDYAAALREDEWDARELVGVDGCIVYWDAPRTTLGGDVHVKAGVLKRYKVVVWDASAGRPVPRQDWVTGVIVNEYTLRQAGGAWKVADSTWWRFYDPETRQLTSGP